MIDKISILFNPSAGRGRAIGKKDRLEEALRKHGVVFDLVVTQSEEELRTLTREHAGTYRTIVGAGGDSTFHIMANEILRAGADVRLGMIGVGSSNDIAKEFGLDNIDRAGAVLRKGGARKIDVGCIVKDGAPLRYYLGQANIGLGAIVNQYVEALLSRRPSLGKRQTLAGLMGAIHAFRSGEIPFPLTVEAESGRVAGDYTVAVFCNIRYWATGKIIAPTAHPGDGKLDACLIGDCSFGRLISIASMSRRGKHVRAKEVEMLSSPSFEITSERSFKIQTDGDILGGYQQPDRFHKITLTAIPQALTVIC
jgi:diacylglycerol kinase (ATP)